MASTRVTNVTESCNLKVDPYQIDIFELRKSKGLFVIQDQSSFHDKLIFIPCKMERRKRGDADGDVVVTKKSTKPREPTGLRGVGEKSMVSQNGE